MDTLRPCCLLLGREGEDGRNIPKDGSMLTDRNVERVSNKHCFHFPGQATLEARHFSIETSACVDSRPIPRARAPPSGSRRKPVATMAPEHRRSIPVSIAT